MVHVHKICRHRKLPAMFAPQLTVNTIVETHPSEHTLIKVEPGKQSGLAGRILGAVGYPDLEVHPE